MLYSPTFFRFLYISITLSLVYILISLLYQNLLFFPYSSYSSHCTSRLVQLDEQDDGRFIWAETNFTSRFTPSCNWEENDPLTGNVVHE